MYFPKLKKLKTKLIDIHNNIEIRKYKKLIYASYTQIIKKIETIHFKLLQILFLEITVQVKNKYDFSCDN